MFTATVCGTNGLAPVPCQTFTLLVQAQPSVVTVASAGGVVGTPVRDVATVIGGAAPTGTVTFRLYSDEACSTEVFTSTVALAGETATSGWFVTAPSIGPI